MTFTLTIDLDNEAFVAGEGDELNAEEVARIIRDVARRVALRYEQGTCMDSNGNRAGEWSIY